MERPVFQQLDPFPLSGIRVPRFLIGGHVTFDLRTIYDDVLQMTKNARLLVLPHLLSLLPL